MRKKTSITALTCVAMLALSCFAFSQATKTSPRIDLGKGLVATISSARSWGSYDGQVPEKPYEYWRTAKGTIIKPMNVYGSSSLMVGGTSETSIGEDSFKSTIMPFASGEYPKGLKAAGRFVEIGLKIANTGDAAASLILIDAAKSTIDAGLSDIKGKYKVGAFLIPGMSIAPVSMITDWGGGLGVKLEPGATTWLLLVFDLPSGIKEAELRVSNAKPVKLAIPDWGRITPSSTYYTGTLVKGPDQPDQSGGNSFSGGTFSFWLTPDRSAIVKFSVDLKDLQWTQDGETRSAPGASTGFSDFTLFIENNKVNASIPSCYDILGAFSSPTRASGTIHLHHFSVGDSKTSLDLGTWQWKAAAAKEGSDAVQ
jgi:hypothetical protein